MKILIPALAANLIAIVGVVIGNAQTTPSSLGNQSFSSVMRLTQSGDYSAPRDAAPDRDGETIYFLANGKSGPGVFKISAHGGRALEFKLGEPFVNPQGLALSSDGKWIFVADLEAGNGGEVLKLSVQTGSIEVLPETTGMAPEGLEVIEQAGADVLYIVGHTDDAQLAVFKLASDQIELLYQGAPLEHPSAVTATKNGVVYVSDSADPKTPGSVYRLENDHAQQIVTGVRLGDPAGLALTPDETVLAVSSHSARGKSQVLLVDLGTLETGVFNRVIGVNSASGGLHRAHGGRSNVFAWADAGRFPGRGGVYLVTPPRY